MGLYIHYYNFHLPKIPSYTTTNKHKIVEYCIYLLVDCVQKWAYTFNTRITASQRSYPPTTTNKHGSIQCYRLLLVDCVQNGPVHQLLELPPPKDPISIPLPGNVGVYIVVDTYL